MSTSSASATSRSHAWTGRPDVMLARTGHTGEYGYKVFVPSGAAPAMRRELLAAGQEWDIRVCSAATLAVCMMEIRFVSLSHDLLPGRGPLETGLNWLIDFGKRDFIGKRALVERWTRGLEELLVCFATDGALHVERGSAIAIDHDVIGTIANVVFSPGLSAQIGVAYLDYDFAVSGLELEILLPSGLRQHCTTVSAPFIVPRSWAMKGGPR